MRSLAFNSFAIAALGLAIVAFSQSADTVAADDITIKQVMKKVNGKNGICPFFKSELASKEPKWDVLSEKAKDLVPLAKAMGKNKPPKGDDASWMKLCSGYEKAAEALEKACADKNLKNAQAAMKTITNCGGCHKLHK